MALSEKAWSPAGSPAHGDLQGWPGGKVRPS